MPLGLAAILAVMGITSLYCILRTARLSKKRKIIFSSLLIGALCLLVLYLILCGVLLAGVD